MVRQNVEVQKSLIGALLIDPQNTAPELMARVCAEDFCLPELRSVFSAAKQLYRDGRPIDPLSVLSLLSEDHKTVIAEAVEVTPSVAHFREYIEIVLADSRRRQAYEQLAELSQALETGAPLEECRRAAAEMCGTLNSAGSGRALSAKELVSLFFASKNQPKEYFGTGFSTLDRYIYFDRGDYMIVGGRPSSGKTVFTLQIAARMARRYRVVYFSLETAAIKLGDRLMANLANIPLQEIKTAQIQDWEAVNRAAPDLGNLQLQVVEASGWTVEQIRAKAVQLKADIVFIDYLSLIKGEGKSLYERVTNISVGLHTFAQQTRIAVAALSQLSREGRGEPDMTHLRESGQLEQDADVILLLHNTNDAQENADRKLIVAKNKEGRTGAVPLIFQGAYQRFIEAQPRKRQ